MASRTEKKLARRAAFLSELCRKLGNPRRASLVRHEHAQRAKRISKRGSHPNSQ